MEKLKLHDLHVLTIQIFINLQYVKEQGYDDVFNFELGNEPDLFYKQHRGPGVMNMNGTQIGQDFKVLHQLLKQYNFTDCALVGPDLANLGSHGSPMFGEFLKVAGPLLTAATFHHYYFNGNTSKPSEYLNPSHFEAYRTEIRKAAHIILRSPAPMLPMSLGEGADAYDSGTVNVSDRFISGKGDHPSLSTNFTDERSP